MASFFSIPAESGQLSWHAWEWKLSRLYDNILQWSSLNPLWGTKSPLKYLEPFWRLLYMMLNYDVSTYLCTWWLIHLFIILRVVYTSILPPCSGFLSGTNVRLEGYFDTATLPPKSWNISRTREHSEALNVNVNVLNSTVLPLLGNQQIGCMFHIILAFILRMPCISFCIAHRCNQHITFMI